MRRRTYIYALSPVYKVAEPIWSAGSPVRTRSVGRHVAGAGRRQRRHGLRRAGGRRGRPPERRKRAADRPAPALRPVPGVRGRTAGRAGRLPHRPRGADRRRPVPAAVPDLDDARDATSSAIADYNDFIQAAAADGHSGVQAFSDGFQRRRQHGPGRRPREHLDEDRGRADLLAGRRPAGGGLRRLLRRELGRGGRRHRRVGRRARRHGGRRPGLDGQRPRRHAGL